MSRKNILVVDDEKSQREILEMILVEEGYDVTTAASGEAALKFAKDRRFDLALTDLKMTGMDGIELLQHLLAYDSSIIVILLTAHGSIESAKEALRRGAFDYLEKPYDKAALEPHIDARTMEIHHGKHHKAYVDNLNKAIAQMPGVSGSLAIDSLLQNLGPLPDNVRTAVRNNGGGHYNHSLFWQMMKKGSGAPKGELAKAIEQTFSGIEGFQERFTDAATRQFGSGWAWLTLDGKKLRIESTPNQDTPLSQGREPLLGLDVWEHAYYLKYQNRRPDYINAWWNLVDWDIVQKRFKR